MPATHANISSTDLLLAFLLGALVVILIVGLIRACSKP